MAFAINPLDKNTIINDNAMSAYTQQFFEANLPLLNILPKIETRDGTFKTKIGPATIDEVDIDTNGMEMTESSHYKKGQDNKWEVEEFGIVDLGTEHSYTKLKLANQPEDIYADINFEMIAMAQELNEGVYSQFIASAPTNDIPLQHFNDTANSNAVFAKLPLVYLELIKQKYDDAGLPIAPNTIILSKNRYAEYRGWLAGAQTGSFSYTGLSNYTLPNVINSGVQLESAPGSAIDYIAFDSNYQAGRLVFMNNDYININGLNTADNGPLAALSAEARIPVAYCYTKSIDLEEVLTTRVRSKLGYQALNPITTCKGRFLSS